MFFKGDPIKILDILFSYVELLPKMSLLEVWSFLWKAIEFPLEKWNLVFKMLKYEYSTV